MSQYSESREIITHSIELRFPIRALTVEEFHEIQIFSEIYKAKCYGMALTFTTAPVYLCHLALETEMVVAKSCFHSLLMTPKIYTAMKANIGCEYPSQLTVALETYFRLDGQFNFNVVLANSYNMRSLRTLWLQALLTQTALQTYTYQDQPAIGD